MNAKKGREKNAFEDKNRHFLWSVYSSIVNTLVYWHEHVAAYVEYKNTQNTRAHRSTHTHTRYLIIPTPAMNPADRISAFVCVCVCVC